MDMGMYVGMTKMFLLAVVVGSEIARFLVLLRQFDYILSETEVFLLVLCRSWVVENL